MRKLQHSSGDPIADRRAGYAEALAAEREFAEAADVLAQAMELVPAWAAGWANLGRYREELGDMAGAVQAWRRSAELDRAGVYGAALKLVARGKYMRPLPAGTQISGGLGKTLSQIPDDVQEYLLMPA